ncbi:MAG: aminopeptidase P family protein [Candidatus Dormibacteraeota bacterium]|nr:aminopeptidase P family protein [Candidatus Dormibacteraeota bacterium]
MSEPVEEQGAAASDGTRTNYDRIPPPALLEFMTQGWEPLPGDVVSPISGLELYQERRRRVAEMFPGQLLVVPSGVGRVRSNDTEYRFRPGTDFLYLVGEGEPDEVLVLEPEEGGGHLARLYCEPEADFTRSDFFTDRVKGVFWVGPRRGLRATASRFGLEALPLAELPRVLAAHDRGAVLRGLDPDVDRLAADIAGPDEEFQARLSEMRLLKDQLEVDLLQEAVDLTVAAFRDVVRELPVSRSERDVEAVFFHRARTGGYDTGYPTIAAAGAHATILHWSHNTGELRPGELLLLDAGVETQRFYTADVTRTLPINGRFTREQRRVYELVWAAQRAGFAEVRPGNDFQAPNRAAQQVLARGLEDLGILPVSAEQALAPDSQLHQRYTLHGVSHMLGLDVHDCAHAAQELYPKGQLAEGMVLTVEPGLYFQPHDGTVPAELRGIGVRIEDDVVVTADGCRVLSAALPSRADEVEAWMAEIWSGGRG